MHAAKHLKMAFWNDATLFGLIYPDRLKTKLQHMLLEVWYGYMLL